MQLDPTIRHFFRVFFEVSNANTNGDPDNDDYPRQLPDDRGYATSYSTKAMVRRFWNRRGEPLYISRDEDITLETKHRTLGVEAGIYPEEGDPKAPRETCVQLDEKITKGFIDGRLFGGVFSTVEKFKGTQVTGPVQITDAVSLCPIHVEEVALTRGVATCDADAQKAKTMGRAYRVTHAIYQFDVSYDAFLGKATKVTAADLHSLLNALRYGFAERATTSKMGIETRLIVHLEQDDPLGGLNYMDLLDDSVKVEVSAEQPTSLRDYSFVVRTFDDTETGRRLSIDEESRSKNINLTVLP
jgi:Cas7 group CRISPR-associated protein Csh2